jgi:hypothetical protein
VLKLDEAKVGLDAIIKRMRLAPAEHRRVQRELRRSLDIYLASRPADMARRVPRVAARLAVQAYRTGQQLPLSELIELAVRLEYWAAVTKPYPDGWQASGIPPADVGGPVRAVVAVAFSVLLPKPLSAALEPYRFDLHEILDRLDRQAGQLLDQMSDLPRPHTEGR